MIMERDHTEANDVLGLFIPALFTNIMSCYHTNVVSLHIVLVFIERLHSEHELTGGTEYQPLVHRNTYCFNFTRI